MAAAFFIGLQYFTVVFTFALAMGVARVFIVAPRLGSTGAVLLEVPIVVLASWVMAYRLLQNRFLTFPQRLAMGATAFTLTMASEAALAALIRGESVADWAASIETPLGLVGLAGQIVFAVMPIFVSHTAPSV